MKKRYQHWLNKWRLKRIIMTLSHACNYGLRPEVMEFARSLEATENMSRGMNDGQMVTITCERRELTRFITYMTRLHSGKLSLLLRARIGLATLMSKDKYVLGEPVDEFMEREFGNAKHSKDDERIIQLHK